MTILEFSNEITQHVLKFLQRSDRPSLAKCLRVCKRWQSIGEPILWRHVFLEDNGDHLSLFYNTIDDTSNGLSFLVESLTLHICRDATWSHHHPKVPNENRISIAGLILLSLPAVKSLSIKCQDSSRDQLHDVLRRVSPSLESFELHYPRDLNVARQWGSALPQCTPWLHICPLLSGILSKVKHFQIQAARLCEDSVPEVREQGSIGKGQTINITLLQAQSRNTSERLAHQIANKLSKLLCAESEDFHNFKSVNVTSYLGRKRRLIPHAWHGFVVRDLKHNIITVTPCYEILRFMATARFDRNDDDGTRYLMRRSDSRSSNGLRDVFTGTFLDLLPGVVPNDWVEDVELKFRFPRAFAESRAGKAGDFNWVPEPYAADAGPDVLFRGTLPERLHRHEASVGRLLLRPMTHDRFDEVTEVLPKETRAEIEAAVNPIDDDFRWMEDELDLDDD